MEILKIEIRSAQNVGKVFISRKKTFPAPFGALPGNFLRGPEKSKNCEILSIFLGGPPAHEREALPLKLGVFFWESCQDVDIDGP